MRAMKIGLTTALIISFSFSAFARPKGTSTVVGCLLVEISGSYTKNPGPVQRRQDIRVACKYLDKKGREKEVFFDTRTDTAGYFKIDNVPAGRYVLKAVDFLFERASRITLASKFGRNSFGEKGRYWGMINGMLMDNIKYLLSDHIDSEPASGVIDLGITFIQIRAEYGTNETGMGKSSPDGKPPWLRINMMDRGSIIDIFLLRDDFFPEMNKVKIGESGRVYTKKSPAAWFGLE